MCDFGREVVKNVLLCTAAQVRLGHLETSRMFHVRGSSGRRTIMEAMHRPKTEARSPHPSYLPVSSVCTHAVYVCVCKGMGARGGGVGGGGVYGGDHRGLVQRHERLCGLAQGTTVNNISQCAWITPTKARQHRDLRRYFPKSRQVLTSLMKKQQLVLVWVHENVNKYVNK